MTAKVLRQWINIALINLLIVTLLGFIMRYKIAYSLPFIDQKNFLHAHSHFAFSGWISQLIMTLLVSFLMVRLAPGSFKKYQRLLGANLITAYGMLFSFIWQGYEFYSIAFSILSFVVAYVFAVAFWRDLSRIEKKDISHYWFKAALIFNIISSAGTYSLVIMMINDVQRSDWLLASIYFFLHFQYNGWFFFSCMGLFSERLNTINSSLKDQKINFWCFSLACVPAYFLSALWLPIPVAVYIVVVVAALAQLFSWYRILAGIFKYRSEIFRAVPVLTRNLMVLSAIALSIKLLLQAASAIPSLSKLAFSFRPVIIGYLHLVLLGVITLFLIGYCRYQNTVARNKVVNSGIIIFITGIILNELFLLIQGFCYMTGITMANINQLLLVASFIMFIGVFLLNTGQLRKKIA